MCLFEYWSFDIVFYLYFVYLLKIRFGGINENFVICFMFFLFCGKKKENVMIEIIVKCCFIVVIFFGGRYFLLMIEFVVLRRDVLMFYVRLFISMICIVCY